MQGGQPAAYWDVLMLIAPLSLFVHGVTEGLVLATALPGRMGWPRGRTWVVVGVSYTVWAPCLVLLASLSDAFWPLGKAIVLYGPFVGPVAWSVVCCPLVRIVAGVGARVLGLRFAASEWWRVYRRALLVASCVSLPTIWLLLAFTATLADTTP